MGKKNYRRVAVKIIGVLSVSLALAVGLVACGNNKAIEAIKKTDTAAATLAPKLKRDMIAAIEAKTKSYTDKAAAAGLTQKLKKAEAAVKKFEALDADYQANASSAKDTHQDLPELKHLHKNEARAYRNLVASIKNPTKRTVRDKAIKSFNSVVSYKGSNKNTDVQDKLHKTYDSKLNAMLSARLEADKKAQQVKDAASTKTKQEAEGAQQQPPQNQAPAQSAPQQNNGGGQNDSGNGGNSYNAGGQNYGGGASSGQQPYTPPAPAPSRPSQSQGGQGEWEVPDQPKGPDGRYLGKDGATHTDADLSQGLVPG